MIRTLRLLFDLASSTFSSLVVLSSSPRQTLPPGSREREVVNAFAFLHALARMSTLPQVPDLGNIGPRIRKRSER